MTWFDYILLILLPLLGGLAAFLFKGIKEDQLRWLMSFSGAYLIGITILHMMPSVYSDLDFQPGIYILAGFLLQIILDRFSKGVEHGHMHVHGHPGSAYLLSVMIGLCLHAFLEGIPLSGFHGDDLHDHHMGHYPLLLGIAVHKLPAAFALTSIFIVSKLRPAMVILLLLIFAVMTPLATFLSDILLSTDTVNIDTIMQIVIAFVIGSFLHISTTILFEVDSKVHKFNVLKMVAIMVGLAMSLLTVW